MPPALSPRMMDFQTDVDMATRWWDDYPRKKFSLIARPKDSLEEFVTEAYSRPKKLMRSASSSNLTYYREADPGSGSFQPFRRSNSVSQLAPSHALCYSDRVPTRYFDTYRSYRPHSDFSGSWYNSAYAPQLYKETHREVNRYHPRKTTSYSNYLQYYDRINSKPRWTTPPSMQSYLRGSQRYMDNYVSHRTKSWDFALPLTYNSYEYHEPSTHRFNRHLLLGSQVFLSSPAGLPKRYGVNQGAWYPYRMHKWSGRVLNL